MKNNCFTTVRNLIVINDIECGKIHNTEKMKNIVNPIIHIKSMGGGVEQCTSTHVSKSVFNIDLVCLLKRFYFL